MAVLPFLLVVYGPLLLVAGFAVAYATGPSAFAGMSPAWVRHAGLLAKTVLLGSTVAAGGTLLSLAVATLLWTERPRRCLWLLALLPGAIPFYVHGFVWNEAGGLDSPLWQLKSLLATNWITVWWVQVCQWAPFTTAILWVSLRSVERRLIDAGRVFRSDSSVYGWVVLPLIAPALLACSGFLFAQSALDFSVPGMLGKTVYSLGLLAEYTVDHDVGRVVWLSLPLLLIGVLGVGLALPVFRRVVEGIAAGDDAWARELRWGRLMAGTLRFTGVLVAVYFVFLLASLLWAGLSHAPEGVVLGRYGAEIAYSIVMAVLAAVAGVALSLPVAWKLGRSNRPAFGWLLLALPLAVPAPLTGIGYLTLADLFPEGLGGSVFAPFFVGVSRFAPMAALLLYAWIRRLDRSRVEMGFLFAPDRMTAWRKIMIPLLSPGMTAAAVLLFTMTLNELPATLLVAAPGYSTTTITVYNLLHYGAKGATAMLSLIMTGAVVLLVTFLVGRLRPAGGRESKSI